MDGYEATRMAFSRIQNLDPENASKVMGLLLIQEHGKKEMIRLAFGSEALVHSVVVKAQNDLGLLPSNSSPRRLQLRLHYLHFFQLRTQNLRVSILIWVFLFYPCVLTTKSKKKKVHLDKQKKAN
ncbi:hypothetical protein QN277_001958 [Acacia crassicarpa]|uniref:AtC3H46-like PABC-like domain-containing protein n=1 Tax=Acacia crassicarpa TaxID=499986 RepID=A0AAE1THK3_9FABA|nr:hypothetical protein QN277_001958 [Acacia crassicarpa]